MQVSKVSTVLGLKHLWNHSLGEKAPRRATESLELGPRAWPAQSPLEFWLVNRAVSIPGVSPGLAQARREASGLAGAVLDVFLEGAVVFRSIQMVVCAVRMMLTGLHPFTPKMLGLGGWSFSGFDPFLDGFSFDP